MGFAKVIGQSKALDLLGQALNSGQLHHAWIFHGPHGVGKEHIAMLFAQALVCPQDKQGCGTCSSCTRVMSHNHPDVMVIMAEQERVERGQAARSDYSHVPSREIRIEQIRQLQERLSYKALESSHRAVLIFG